MRKHRSLKALALCLVAALLFMGTATAEETPLTPGVTVAADPGSPTGYTVTFVYEDAEAEKVDVVGTFNFYKEGGKNGSIPSQAYSPFEYEPGMFRANFNDFPATVAMEKVEGSNYWQVAMPLPSGHFLYNYKVNDSETYTPDPANPPMASTVTSGNASKLSTVDVPYDPIQGSSTDFTFLLPRTDEQVGQVVYDEYVNIDGETAPLAIYLPYGYDASRAEGYNTIYLAHGTGGSEMEWFASGNTDHIFDNLIAEGAVEPTVVVTMMNTQWRNVTFNFYYIVENVMKHIIPFMESNYNVSTEPAGRAFAGLSFGSRTTSNVYAAYPDQFGYFGCFSGADGLINLDTSKLERLSFPTIVTGNGCYESITAGHLTSQLKTLGIPYSEYTVKGAHDWTVWQVMLKIFATEYLWK